MKTLLPFLFIPKQLSYSVVTSTQSGSLYQLSQVYSQYGYDPKAGTKLSNGHTSVTGSNNRVYYSRPSPDAPTNAMWDQFTFVVSKNGGADSYPATVTLVPPSGALVGSDFLLGNDGWTIVGNKVKSEKSVFEAYSRGPLLNHYVYATDDIINVQTTGGSDSSLWFFQAPPKYLGNFGISYGGHIRFTLVSFSGDFSRTNKNVNLVELECEDCQGPIGRGIKLVFPVSAMIWTSFNGEPAKFAVPLLEDAGWLKDPQNSLTKWTKPSKCDLIQVLSRLSSFRILGDWTTWYESVALDDVSFTNTRGQLPICAMERPDASICTCVHSS